MRNANFWSNYFDLKPPGPPVVNNVKGDTLLIGSGQLSTMLRETPFL